jgi:hypothetical protein
VQGRGPKSVLEAVQIYDSNFSETREIRLIQCEDMPDVVDNHRRCETSIVHLNARNIVTENDSSLFSVNRIAVLQQAHALLDRAHFTLCFGHS